MRVVADFILILWGVWGALKDNGILLVGAGTWDVPHDTARRRRSHQLSNEHAQINIFANSQINSFNLINSFIKHPKSVSPEDPVFYVLMETFAPWLSRTTAPSSFLGVGEGPACEFLTNLFDDSGSRPHNRYRLAVQRKMSIPHVKDSSNSGVLTVSFWGSSTVSPWGHKNLQTVYSEMLCLLTCLNEVSNK